MFKIKKIKNFAVIAKSEDDIELKDLTIFMGDNSAGKSYLAMLIHSFVTMTRGYQDKDFLKAINSKFSELHLIVNLKQTISKIVESDNDKIVLSFNKKDLLDLKEIIRFSINDYLLKKYLTKTLFENENLEEIEIELIKLENVLPSRLTIENIQINDRTTIEVLIDDKYKSGASFQGDFDKEFIISETINNIISNLVQHTVKQTLTVNSVYLPASRTGYLQTYKALANQAIFKSYNADNENSKNHLSIIIRFFITQLNTNTEFKNTEFSEFIENLIMKGTVGIFEDNNNIEFKLKNGDSVNLNYLSSTVSELIPLVVFLKRGLIKRGGLLVIEEPEAHLSFENQKLMAKLIALFLENNIKVLITTHSDFLIYELNNLILKNSIIKNRDEIDKQEYEAVIKDEISIQYKKIALYNFILKNDKSTIQRVKIDKYGINNKYIFDNTYSLTKEKNQLINILDSIDA